MTIFKPTAEMLQRELTRQQEKLAAIRKKDEWMLYALKLENGKFYIGRTFDVHWRYRSHHAGDGAKWTRLHRPLDLIEVRRIENALKSKPDLAESKLTIEYMARYGWENVRGGDFTALDNDSIREQLAKACLLDVIAMLKTR